MKTRGKTTLHKVFEHDMVQLDLLEIAQKAKDAKRLCKVFESVKFAYVHMATNRSNENVVYQNALLSVVVSSKHKGSQSFMSKTIGVSRYSLKKAIVRRVHVDQIGENIWGGAFFENGDVMCLMKRTTTSSRIDEIQQQQSH